jgi:hypothetical protein
VTLDTPVPVTAGTTYVASGHTSTGDYSATASYFTQTYDNPPMTALATGTDGPNGVYLYGAGGFPTQTWEGGNYWVDVVYADEVGEDTTPPTVTATVPNDGATNVAVDAPVSATFSEAIDQATLDGNLLLVDAADGPVEGTVTYSAGSRTATFTATTELEPGATYTATVVGGADGVTDLAGNPLAEDRTWTFTTAEPTEPGSCPCSIWTGTETPGATDRHGRRRARHQVPVDTDGEITGLRFYKPAGMTGTKTGRLWTTGGTMLGELTFTGETASGWQEASFGQPIAIDADTTYVASYHAPAGGYAFSAGFFATTGVDNPPLRALQDGEDGPNGVYTYGPAGGFPTNTFDSSNYWVDVVFDDEIGPDETPPTVIGTVPTADATGVPVSTTVRARSTSPSTPTASPAASRSATRWTSRSRGPSRTSPRPARSCSPRPSRSRRRRRTPPPSRASATSRGTPWPVPPRGRSRPLHPRRPRRTRGTADRS